MALSGASLMELIEENQLAGISFNGIVHIGNENYIEDGVFSYPDEFKFTTEFSSSVSSAQKFGVGYLITTNCRTSTFTMEEVQKAILNGCWRIVLVF